MRKQFVAIFSIAIVAICLLVFFIGKSRHERISENAGVPVVTDNAPASANTAAKPALSAYPTAPPSSEDKQNRPTALSDELSEYAKQTPQPIAFYGKVVDENMQPVAGANIDFNYNTFKPEASFQANTVSDGNGLFSISGVSGITLSVSVSKDGYYSLRNSNQVQFVYLAPPGSVAFQPDVTTPIVFHLSKKSVGADLISSKHGVSPYLTLNPAKDGTPIWIDLLQRKAGDSGQLEVQQWLDVDPDTKRAQSWKLKLSIPDGGFVSVQDELPFTAPESGYQSQLNLPIPDTNGNVQFGLSQKVFYIAFGNPRLYGRIEVNASEQTGAVWFQYVVNPNGSTNLEPK